MGYPASGKTTLARKIADKLSLPFMSKDETFKELMFDEFQTTTREWSIKVGKASYRIMSELIEQQLRAGYDIVIESVFKYEFDNPDFMALQEKYNFTAIQVLCQGDTDILIKRFIDRATQTRHDGHGEDDLSVEGVRKTYYQDGEKLQPFTLKGTVIEVDANSFSETKTEGAIQQVIDAYTA